MYLMAKAAERMPIGTVYPVWTGIGAVGAVIVGIVFFHESATFWRIFFITTLILSIIGLKVMAWQGERCCPPLYYRGALQAGNS